MLVSCHIKSENCRTSHCSIQKEKSVSQEVLSGLADIGRTHLSAIERGERKPTLETLYRISTALNVSMSDIVKEIERQIEH